MDPPLAALLRAFAALATHLAAAPLAPADRPVMDATLDLAADLIGLTRSALDPALPPERRREALQAVARTATVAADRL